MANYKKSSPYYLTKQNNLNLETLSIRPVPAEADDFLYKIENQYNQRPDLLAFDLYGTPKLWWVFVQRNMNVIKDPIYDLYAGQVIYLPKQSSLKKQLGI
jgi:hypothetical protein